MNSPPANTALLERAKLCQCGICEACEYAENYSRSSKRLLTADELQELLDCYKGTPAGVVDAEVVAACIELQERRRADEPKASMLAICTAYESGFGHGCAADNLANPYAENTIEYEAYHFGYESGITSTKREPLPPTASLIDHIRANKELADNNMELRGLLREARPYIESFSRLTKLETAEIDALKLRDQIVAALRVPETKPAAPDDPAWYENLEFAPPADPAPDETEAAQETGPRHRVVMSCEACGGAAIGRAQYSPGELPCNKCGKGLDLHVGIGMPCPTDICDCDIPTRFLSDAVVCGVCGGSL